MKHLIAAFVVVAACTNSVAALKIDPFKGPKPIAVLIQTNPWLSVIGSDTPRIAVYEDGQVIFLGKDKTLQHKVLDGKGLTEIKQKLASFGDYSKLKSSYNLAPNVFDLPSTRMYLKPESREYAVEIYGLMTEGTELPATSSFPGDEKPDKLPESLRALHSYLTSLTFPDSKPWKPAFVEAMIWSYEYAPEQSIHWPKEWPGLKSSNTLKRGDSYSIFLPGSDEAKLRAFLKTEKEKGAVEIDGKKWAVSVRRTFPSEPVWFKAFEKVWEEEAKKSKE